MESNKFSLNICIRVILIVTNCFFLVTEYVSGEYKFTIINLAILLVLQTFLLIKYIRKINFQTIEYFDLIKNKESGFRLTDTESKNSFSLLRKQFNETNQIIQDIRIEKEVQSNYLSHLVNHVNIGLLSFDENEKIQFVNPEAKRILGIKNIFHLKDLNSLNKSFDEFLRHIQPNQSEIIEIKGNSENQKLSVNCGLLCLRDTKIKLISFHDIDKHLYTNEIESWNKLIRILNHEIMNSITPITSLTKTIKKYFSDGESIINPENIQSSTINRIVEGLNIIEERGIGLINFVNNYRKLTALPEPQKTNFNLNKFFTLIKDLFNEELTNNQVELKIETKPDDLSLNADKDQLTQIFINLIKNSLDGLNEKEKGFIELKASKNNNVIQLSITDNGKGIPQNIIKDIFIPFYTTKESGSGIGLSLSKQIMQMHDGTISVSSVPDIKTKFKLGFYYL